MFLKVLVLLSRRQRRTLLWQIVAIIALATACIPEPELLNSDRIELRYGSYGVRLLHSDEQQRVSSLYSGEAEGEICRTFAIVDFILPPDSRVIAEHRSILAGGSIGQVFRQAGWQTEKYTLTIGETQAGAYRGPIAELMQLDPVVALAIHRYRFEVVRGALRIPYAVITEIHHPDYLTVQQLHDIYD